jgi:hypothetical protein
MIAGHTDADIRAYAAVTDSLRNRGFDVRSPPACAGAIQVPEYAGFNPACGLCDHLSPAGHGFPRGDTWPKYPPVTVEYRV